MHIRSQAMPQNLTAWIVVIVALALGFVLGRLSGRGGERRDDLMGLPRQQANSPFQSAPRMVTQTAAQPSAEALKAVRAELAAGNTIAAIKLLREATGLGLREAKDAVERMERG
jgi:hypothetical protein